MAHMQCMVECIAHIVQGGLSRPLAISGHSSGRFRICEGGPAPAVLHTGLAAEISYIYNVNSAFYFAFLAGPPGSCYTYRIH